MVSHLGLHCSSTSFDVDFQSKMVRCLIMLIEATLHVFITFLTACLLN